LWHESFVKPAAGPNGSPFGLRRYFNGQPRSPHSGLDIKAPDGSEVTASNDGEIVLAENLFFTGNTIIVDHGLGLYTIYAHLSRMEVGVGDEVRRSQVIGRVGATGRVTGPHLHWAVKLGGSRVDPAMLPGAAL
jgi:murein DD-endopeptidase MepM/ murein hydrolase activator NlpD